EALACATALAPAPGSEALARAAAPAPATGLCANGFEPTMISAWRRWSDTRSPFLSGEPSPSAPPEADPLTRPPRPDGEGSADMVLAERIALMVADHRSVEEVCQELCSDGADRPDLLGVVREYDSHPLMRLSQHLALELKKRNHLLSVYRDINSASQFSGTV